jgi:hypothetical protein
MSRYLGDIVLKRNSVSMGRGGLKNFNATCANGTINIYSVG